MEYRAHLGLREAKTTQRPSGRRQDDPSGNLRDTPDQLRDEVEREEEARRQRELARQESMDRMKKSILDKSRENVKAWASIVRQRTDSRFHKGFSTFDAYVTGEYGETVQFFGTADERFRSCPGSGGKEKWRILPVGEVHNQPAAWQGGHRRNAP